jgi:hypothetical protein
LLEDFETDYQQIQQGKAIQLLPKTTSFKQWSERLTNYAKSLEIKHEVDYWLTQLPQKITPIPIDYIEEENTVSTAQSVSIKLNIDETQALLQEVPKIYNTQINDVLLTAWCKLFRSGHNKIRY